MLSWVDGLDYHETEDSTDCADAEEMCCEKQEVQVSLWQQPDDLKACRHELVCRLQSSGLGVKHRSKLNSGLEKKNQIAATMTQLE